MARSILIILLAILFAACESKPTQFGYHETHASETPDSVNIIEMARVMADDVYRMVLDNDIQSVASLCQEATDNIDYFRSIGDSNSARVYAHYLREYFKEHPDTIEDMATQNYVIKSFMTAIRHAGDLSESRKADSLARPRSH